MIRHQPHFAPRIEPIAQGWVVRAADPEAARRELTLFLTAAGRATALDALTRSSEQHGQYRRFMPGSGGAPWGMARVTDGGFTASVFLLDPSDIPTHITENFSKEATAA